MCKRAAIILGTLFLIHAAPCVANRNNDAMILATISAITSLGINTCVNCPLKANVYGLLALSAGYGVIWLWESCHNNNFFNHRQNLEWMVGGYLVGAGCGRYINNTVNNTVNRVITSRVV